MKRRVQVSLRLLSKHKTVEGLSSLGILPEKTWRTGERRGNTKLLERENGCEFMSLLSESRPLEDHVSTLLERLEPIAEGIRGLDCDDVQLTCVIYDTRVPGLNFSRSSIERLSRLGASIDVDLYLTEANCA